VNQKIKKRDKSHIFLIVFAFCLLLVYLIKIVILEKIFLTLTLLTFITMSISSIKNILKDKKTSELLSKNIIYLLSLLIVFIDLFLLLILLSVLDISFINLYKKYLNLIFTINVYTLGILIIIIMTYFSIASSTLLYEISKNKVDDKFINLLNLKSKKRRNVIMVLLSFVTIGGIYVVYYILKKIFIE